MGIVIVAALAAIAEGLPPVAANHVPTPRNVGQRSAITGAAVSSKVRRVSASEWSSMKAA
jgi:hypothetical protein